MISTPRNKSNDIKVTGPSVSFIKVNEDLNVDNEVMVSDNIFNNSKSPVVSGSNGIILSNNN